MSKYKIITVRLSDNDIEYLDSILHELNSRYSDMGVSVTRSDAVRYCIGTVVSSFSTGNTPSV